MQTLFSQTVCKRGTHFDFFNLYDMLVGKSDHTCQKIPFSNDFGTGTFNAKVDEP